jgi:hypothetical protein
VPSAAREYLPAPQASRARQPAPLIIGDLDIVMILHPVIADE